MIKICALCFSLVLILDSSLLYQVNALYNRSSKPGKVSRYHFLVSIFILNNNFLRAETGYILNKHSPL